MRLVKSAPRWVVLLKAVECALPSPTVELEATLRALYEQSPLPPYELIERPVIRSAFEFSENNPVQAARLFGVTRSLFRHRLSRKGLLRPKAPTTCTRRLPRKAAAGCITSRLPKLGHGGKRLS